MSVFLYEADLKSSKNGGFLVNVFLLNIYIYIYIYFFFCTLNRGPGRRKRMPSDPNSCGTPIKIAIKRPYLEENDDSETQYNNGRKYEEEMIVNVCSPLTNENGYFTSGELNKSNDSESLLVRRANGFSSSDDKLGFPSMIYTTFSHQPTGAVTLSQSFDSRNTSTTLPKTTLIQPINGQMSPLAECNYTSSNAERSMEQGSDSAMTDISDPPNSATMNHTTPDNVTSPQSLAEYTPNSTPVAMSSAGKAMQV